MSYLHGIPFVVSSDRRTREIMKLLHPKKDERIADLGSGDGKLLFKFAKAGSKAYGYEINPIAYLQSIIRTKRMGLKNVEIHYGDFMKADLSKYDAIVIYGFPSFMPKLEKKLKSELKPGTRIVSNFFKFPNWKPSGILGDCLLYIV